MSLWSLYLPCAYWLRSMTSAPSSYNQYSKMNGIMSMRLRFARASSSSSTRNGSKRSKNESNATINTSFKYSRKRKRLHWRCRSMQGENRRSKDKINSKALRPSKNHRAKIPNMPAQRVFRNKGRMISLLRNIKYLLPLSNTTKSTRQPGQAVRVAMQTYNSHSRY